MNEGIKKFRELLLTNEEFQQKLKAAAENYTGEQTEEAVFHGILAPLAEEYGISAAYEDFRDFITADQEIDKAELEQLAAGKSGGVGGIFCFGGGIGLGGGGGDGTGGGCVIIGGGWGSYKCYGSGDSSTFS